MLTITVNVGLSDGPSLWRNNVWNYLLSPISKLKLKRYICSTGDTISTQKHQVILDLLLSKQSFLRRTVKKQQ